MQERCPTPGSIWSLEIELFSVALTCPGHLASFCDLLSQATPLHKHRSGQTAAHILHIAGEPVRAFLV
jgi:hypothetical protein